MSFSTTSIGTARCPWCRSPHCASSGCLAAHVERLERENAELRYRNHRLEYELQTLRESFNAKRNYEKPEVVRRARRPAPSVPARRQPVPVSPGGWR